MTNREYKRLTFRPNNAGEICGIGLKASSEEIAERLYVLEEMIENNTLLFLRCKVGDEFWWILNSCDRYILRSETVASIEIYEDGEIYIVDNSHHIWSIDSSSIYFSKEAAEKALRELENDK